MAKNAKIARKMEYDLSKDKKVGAKRNTFQSVCRTAERTDNKDKNRTDFHRQYKYKSSSGRTRSGKKNGQQSIGKSRGGWNTKLHVGAVDGRIPVELSLSGGESADCVEGCRLILAMGPVSTKINLIMDKAYEDNKTRNLAVLLGYTPVVPPKSNRVEPWEYDKEEYKCRNVVERFFRRYKEYRRICTRYDKLDIMFLNYFIFALIIEFLR